MSKTLFKKIGFKPEGSQFVVTDKLRLYYAVSLRTKLSNANRLYEPKSSQRVDRWDSNLIFDLTQLLAAGESLLRYYPIVADYIL